jgi:flagellar basal body-associated protein FliL
VNRKTSGIIVMFVLLLATFAIGSSTAGSSPYIARATTQVLISSNGSFFASEPNASIAYEISGIPGAEGTVTATVYNGNPQASAATPNGISLVHFVVVTINMNDYEFVHAKISITLNNDDASSIQPPYTAYKYMASSDSFVPVPASVDMNAKTVTITLTSLDDPLFAIGGAPAAPVSQTASSWLILIACTIVIVLLAVVLVTYLRRSEKRKLSFH